MAEYIDRVQLLADIENTIRISAKDTDSSELRGARKVIDRINNYRIKSVNDMALEYDELYDNNAKIIELKHDTLRSNLEKAVLIENIITQLSGKSYSDDYFAIINSRKWRLVSKIKIPKSGKKVVKKILKRNKK